VNKDQIAFDGHRVVRVTLKAQLRISAPPAP
jgi:hypothetical protein